MSENAVHVKACKIFAILKCEKHTVKTQNKLGLLRRIKLTCQQMHGVVQR